MENCLMLNFHSCLKNTGHSLDYVYIFLVQLSILLCNNESLRKIRLYVHCLFLFRIIIHSCSESTSFSLSILVSNNQFTRWFVYSFLFIHSCSECTSFSLTKKCVDKKFWSKKNKTRLMFSGEGWLRKKVNNWQNRWNVYLRLISCFLGQVSLF